LEKNKDVLIIPRHLVTLRFIELPSTDTSEISSMAEFQALKELPYPKEEIITSFRNMGSYKKGFSCIMLAIIKRELVKEMMANRKIQPENIRLETELLYLYLLKEGIIKQDRVNLVINIKKDYSEIIIIDNIRPVFSRGFRNDDGLLEEINRSMAAYKKDKNNKDIEEAVIMHAYGLDIENIKLHIKESFDTTINYYEYKEDLKNLEFPLEIDLSPREYIDKRLSRENRKEFFTTYLLLLIVVGMLVSFFIFKVQEKNEIITMLNENGNKIQKEAEELNAFLKKTEILKSEKEEGELIINILKESYELVPGDIYLSGLDYDGKDAIYYKGTTRDMPSVFNFIKAIEKSKYFKKAEVKYATKKNIGNQKVTDFSIACQVK
jgi:Tfp pilus assembly protein PilN